MMKIPVLFVEKGTLSFLASEELREAATPAGTARAEDPLWQMLFLPKLAEAVPAESVRR
ncbi:hypothetical protein GCM10008935_20570 [Alkalibacillus silvisoli]|uniref:Uncharacterized protein n=1 Tax=Alkalibacillus silvisoli TaxID=392823 RepID=A0ABN1A0N1_9BACI